MYKKYQRNTSHKKSSHKSSSNTGIGCFSVFVISIIFIVGLFTGNSTHQSSKNYRYSSNYSRSNHYNSSNNSYNERREDKYTQFVGYNDEVFSKSTTNDSNEKKNNSENQTNKSDDKDDRVKKSDIDEDQTYVLNKHTKVFHRTWCRDVEKIKKKNYKKFKGTREKAIKKGYRPCKHCNP